MRVLNKKFKLYRRYKTDFWGQPSLVRSRSKRSLFSEIIRSSPFSLRKKLIAYAPHRYFSLNRYRFKGFPGRRANKFSGYFSALQAEKSKFQIFYHSMRERQIRHLVKISSYKKGVFVDNFVSLIERRLDIILFRSLLLFPSTTVQINRFLSHRSIDVLRVQSGGKQQKKKFFFDVQIRI